MDDKKLVLQMEFSRKEVNGVCFLTGEDITEADWEKMTEKPIVLNINNLPADSDDKKQLTIAMVFLAIGQYKEL